MNDAGEHTTERKTNENTWKKISQIYYFKVQAGQEKDKWSLLKNIIHYY